MAALRRYRIHDTIPDPGFDRIVALAADLLAAPIALISLTDKDRQWVMAASGLNPAESGVACALSQQTVHRGCVHIVSDPALIDAAGGIAFYAAAPLMTPDGVVVGALSVLDRTSRAGLPDSDRCRLEKLAGLVINLLERQREHDEQNRDRTEIALMRDIHAVLTENLSFAETLDLILSRMLRAFGAYACRVWERRGADPFVCMVSRVCVDPIAPDHHESMAGEHVNLGDLYTAELFESENATMWRTVDPADLHHPRLGPAVVAGISSLIGCSFKAGDRRFSLVMTMKGPQGDLPGCAALLGRVGQAIRPVLQRKLSNERTALLGAALEATYDGVIIAEITHQEDHYHRILYINAALTEQTGYQSRDLLGQPLAILDVPDADETEICRIKMAMRRGEPVRSTLRCRRRDGSDFWAETTLVPLLDAEGVATHRVGIMRDMTQQRAEAEELRTRERRLLATTLKLEKLTTQLIRTQEIARLGTWRQEIGSEIVEWSDSVYPMFGETKCHFTPTVPAIVAKVHPDDREAVHARLVRAGQGAVTNALDYRTIAADGAVRTVTSDYSCEYADDGRMIAISGILQDVTEQKHAQAMLLQAEKLRSIGQLTGGIAHDFNNLLTVVSVNLEMLGDMIGTDHPAEELRAMALRAADNGARLTGNLLAFARRQSLQPEPCQVNVLLSGLKDMAAHSIGERHPITLKLDADLPHCLLDRSGFESAMLNLLVNSRDAMGDGGLITIATSLEHLRPDGGNASSPLRNGAYICVSVSDTGTGIEPHLQERVFEPFFTTKPVGKGTGLGLSTVIGFVRQSGGDVALASTPGRGTRVTLYLPVLITPGVSMPTDRTPDTLASFPIG